MSDPVVQEAARTPAAKRKRSGFAVRVTTERGEDMYLRRGARPGYGPVVRFATRKDAEMAIATMEPGFDAGWSAAVVPYSEAQR